MHSLCTKIGILPERQCKDTTSPMRKYPHGSASFRKVPICSAFVFISVGAPLVDAPMYMDCVGAGFARPNNTTNDTGGQTPPLRRASLGTIIEYPIQNEHISHISFFVSKNRHTFVHSSKQTCVCRTIPIFIIAVPSV